jgi:hypothetical protein
VRNAAAVVCLLALLAWVPDSQAASEAVTEDRPAPESVEEAVTPMERSFEEEWKIPALFPRLKDRLRHLSPVFRDSELDLQFRSYYFRAKNFDNSKSEAWTLGGSLAYQSGWHDDWIAVGAKLYTSQKLHGPSDRDGTQLLRPEQRSYTVMGQTYARLRFRERHEVWLYRREYDLPYVNKDDSRMTPNTFEGYTVRGTLLGGASQPKLRYVGGYLTRMKKRDSDRFVPMGEAAGAVGGAKRGLWMAGALLSTGKLTFGAIDYLTPDVLNIFYSEFDRTWSISDELAVRLGAQFTDQRSVGDDLLTGSFFDTRVWGARLAASYKGATLRFAFSTTSSEADIRHPFGNYPGYLSLMTRKFNRAGEDAWLVGIAYHFRRVGLEGLSTFVNVARGSDIQDELSGASLPDETEVDITLDYRPERGPLKGFWLRLRAAFVHSEGSHPSSNNLRVILRYDFPVL